MKASEVEAERNKRIAELEKTDIENLLRHESGRRFVWRLLSFCGIYRDIESNNPIDIARHIGKQNVGRFILAITSEADEEAIFKMMREAKDIDRREEYVREQSRREQYESEYDEYGYSDIEPGELGDDASEHGYESNPEFDIDELI